MHICIFIKKLAEGEEGGERKSKCLSKTKQCSCTDGDERNYRAEIGSSSLLTHAAILKYNIIYILYIMQMVIIIIINGHTWG